MEETSPPEATLPGIILSFGDVCKKHSVNFFAWGEFALAILNSDCPGALQTISSLEHYDFFVAAKDEDTIQAVFKDFSKRLSSLNTTCSLKMYDTIPLKCALSLGKVGNREIHVHGPGIIKDQELHLINKNLIRSHVFKLSRFFPVVIAGLNNLLVPVPNDPVFVYSHIVPFSSDSKVPSYTLGQGCEVLHSKCPIKPTKINDTKLFGPLNTVTFNDLCVKNEFIDVFPPLEAILKANKANELLRFEEFQQIVPLEKGNGDYKLRDNNKRKGWSQYGQEDFVTNFFNNKTNGFFIEVGGFDGEQFSNTLYLERELQWDGVLIEAIPPLYKILKSKNRRCFSLNSCVSNTVEVQNFVHAGALSSSDLAMTDRHKKRIQREHAQRVPQKYRVYCKSFLSILDAIGTRKVDFFSLDVEGGELIILNAIDFEKVDIELFTIETDQHRNEIIKFMESKGYKRIHKLKGDDLFQKIRK